MKTRFSTLDICAALSEIQQKAVGLRLVNVYDIDNKTYLFKLSKPDLKLMLLVESGIRIHLSEFEWPKNNIPSGFAMKMRKHLRGRRLVSVTQLGSDRIIDLQFGSDEAAFHVFLELYDRGNIALTDHKDIILNLLRFRKNKNLKGEHVKDEDDDVRFAVHEPYPRHSARPVEPLISVESLQEIFKEAKHDALIKRILTPHLPYGAACIDHCLSIAGFNVNSKLGKDFVIERDIPTLHAALAEAELFVEKAKSGDCKGFITQKREKKTDGEFLANVEFHPFLFEQHKKQPYKELPTFNQAVDEFYSSLESQRSDMKVLQRERAAYRKLDNVRRDHETRLQALRNEQDEDKRKALIIENNLELVDQAIRVICSAIANQVNWEEIKSLVTDAQARGDQVALAIKSLKLETNAMVMSLSESPSDDDDSDFDSFDEDSKGRKPPGKKKPVKVDIDLSLSAYANAQSYYNKKRQAAQKEQRTLDASAKAFKSAEKKTKQTLKEAAVISNIQKARKIFWFEKFLWFISSENYLVLGGRDAQQNEILVKKYLKTGDIYVHADLHGATSCIIKNSTGLPVAPKTLNEAGTMAICHSAAWDAKVITSAWWVYHDQVSKTAPSGEYLTTGSFMIRGRKNYLPPSYLIYGFGFLFKVDETCIWKHKGERKVRSMEDDMSSIANTTDQMEEIELDSEQDESEDNDQSKAILAADVTTADVASSDEETSKDDTVDVTGHDETDPTENVKKEIQNKKHDLVNSAQEISSTHLENKEDEVAASSDESSDDETTNELEYPDTQVKFSVVDKYQLESYHNEKGDVQDDVIYMGDDVPVSMKFEKQNDDWKVKPKMSAKQKREMKKQQKKQQDNDDGATEVLEENDGTEERKYKKDAKPQQAYIRGQKKKLRRKNNDFSDEEDEKQKVMEMLQSAKPKEKKKNRKQAQMKMAKDAEAKKSQRNANATKKSGANPRERNRASGNTDKPYDSEEERELALREENLQLKEVTNALDSLTGIPSTDDILLFAIPVCAPYNTMQNYKFKVKLTPGTGKKGKAAKTALGMFQATRDVTAQEKDHLRSVKDYDLSRNMPGKVKVSAPNLKRLRRKKK